MRKIRIAIDGPSGSGKSTIGKRVAQRLGFVYIDSGAMYRAVARQALAAGIPLMDEARVVELAQNLTIEFVPGEKGQHLLVNGEDMTEAIRTPAVAQGASRVSAIPGVRRALVRRQKEMGAAGGVVMDGRDIGTVVFPDAEVKVFLDAALPERARRRYLEDRRRGETADLAATEKDVAERDRRDTTRADSPLRQAEDAVRVDTTGLDIEAVTRRVLDIVAAKVG
ncbi:MAG: (d)CMP kinase [Acidobacteria bacterium]|nr:(d)CMP kinase [Acidobacteriota bacterium]